jgi:hypothetical protein
MVTFLISLKTPPTTNIPNLQEALGWLIEEAAGDGVWDVDGMRVDLPVVSDVVITPFTLMETTPT